MARRASDTADSRPILSAVLDAAALGSDVRGRGRELFANGVDWIQLRDRSVDDQTLFSIARALVEASDEARSEPAREASTTDRDDRGSGGDAARGMRRPAVIINKRIDIARAAGAHGAHLGFDSLSPQVGRRLLPPGASIGVSLHSVEEVKALTTSAEARSDPRPLPDYVYLAPIWNPRSKPASRPALGPAVLADACGFGIPVIAQGGVDLTRAEEAVRAGAAGVAVSGLLMEARDLGALVRDLRQRLDRARLATHDR